MKTFQLTAEPRTDLGKKAAKAIRKENKIPVVLNGGEIVALPYEKALKPGEKIVEIGNGKGLITTDLTVDRDAVRKLIYTPDIFAIELTVNGEKRMAVLKDIQFHPVKDSILHIDLGKTLQIGDLHFEGLELVNAKNAVVCAVQLTRAARGAQATAQ